MNMLSSLFLVMFYVGVVLLSFWAATPLGTPVQIVVASLVAIVSFRIFNSVVDKFPARDIESDEK